MIHNEDCLDTMRRMDAGSVDLVVTSPPYAGKRSDQYPVPTVDGYLDWFLPISRGIRRILKPDGSFILNIKEGTTDGERQIYVLELVLALRLQGWRWVDEYIWYKPNPLPGKWKDRLKDGFERCHHFVRAPGFKFNPDAVRQDLSPGQKYYRDHPATANTRNEDVETKTGSGRMVNRVRMRAITTVIPSNVIPVGIGRSNVKHPARYPPALPEFFIKLLSDPGDLVYDPFAGSGTTLAAAKSLGRRWVGSEISAEYCGIIQRRMEPGP